jgi:Cell wall-active antibiotics response 4TMS YvqF
LPPGDTPLDLRVGVGRAALIVPRDVCVATSAEVGMGAVDVFDRNNGGVDLSWDEQPRASDATGRLVLNADVGLGAVEVSHERRDLDGPGFGRRFGDDDSVGSGLGRRFGGDDGDGGSDVAGNAACEASANGTSAGA